MNITDVRIRKLIHPDMNGKQLCAVVSVTFDDVFVVHDIKVIRGPDRLFIAMPSKKMENGTYKDIVHPINQSFRTTIQEAVLASYREAVEEEKNN